MARKKPVKANNLSGLWKRIDDLAPTYLEAAPSTRKKYLKELREVMDEANSSPIPKSIVDSFVGPYFGESKQQQVCFGGEGKDKFGDWATNYDPEENLMKIDPVGLHKFSSDMDNAPQRLRRLSLERHYNAFRRLSFYRELGKLPKPYLVFLAVLKEVAVRTNVVDVEKRDGGYAKADAPEYLSMLWAFKQFETFYQRVQNRSLRSDYGIIWHEGEWIESIRKP